MIKALVSLALVTLFLGCSGSNEEAAKPKHISTTPQVAFTADEGRESLIVPTYFESGIKDADHDGVADGRDQCEETPVSVEVDEKGCAYDRDQDGVKDYEDECPSSMAHAKVKANGCADFFSFRLYYAPRVNSITPKSMLVLEKAVGFLREHPEYKVKIVGHTDNIGDDNYNLELSKERAAEVLKIFNRKGIDFERLSSDGKGESEPVSSNDTDAGRQENRRIDVELFQDLK